MKKNIIKLLILFIISLLSLAFIWNTYAEKTSNWITVIVTEKIPGANCWDNLSEKWENPRYECNVSKWFSSIIVMMWNIIKYFTFIAALWAVLFIIVNGIMYSMWGIDPWMKDEAKKRITWTLIWLILLFLSWVILNMIAPWIYK